MNERKTRGRPGSASIEAVMTTAVSLPVIVSLFYLGIRAARGYYFLISNLVGWPCM